MREVCAAPTADAFRTAKEPELREVSDFERHVQIVNKGGGCLDRGERRTYPFLDEFAWKE